MTVDEGLLRRLRDELGWLAGITEKKMMGGVCFLLRGHMIAAADRAPGGQGRFMFRVGWENDERGSALPGAEPVVDGGRRMGGLFFVGEDNCRGEALHPWLSLAVEHAAGLPAKPA
ncbi:MAG: RNA methyltransferase [Pseudomonadota bacterium]